MSSVPETAGIGVKGAAVYTTTGDARVDLNMKLVRGAAAEELTAGLDAVLAAEHDADAFVMTVHARNVRGGKGERDIARAMLRHLWTVRSAEAEMVLELWPRYGCWRDLFQLAEDAGTPVSLRDAIVALTVAQLRTDEDTPVGQSISLCAKWAPRERSGGGGSDHKFPTLLRLLAGALFPAVDTGAGKLRAYRKLVAGLNRRLGTVETRMCAGEWAEIRPEAIPGRAGKLYGRALLNLVSTKGLRGRAERDALRCPDDAGRMACRERFLAHLRAAAEGRARVNGGKTVFPHEIVKKAWADGAGMPAEEKLQLSALWRAIVEETVVGGGLGRSVMMCDFSGSMQSAGAVGDLPYWVSMTLGILGSQVARGAFRGRMMTFETEPKWHRYPVGADGGVADLFACLGTLRAHMPIGFSTDFEKAMELLFTTLNEEGVVPGEELENIIVLTDMGWNAAGGAHADRWETLLEGFRRRFQERGWTVPRIVIWNLAAQYSSDHHAQADTPGVGLLSGWSAAQFRVLQKEGPRSLTPLEVLRLELDDPMYDPVRAALALCASADTGTTTALCASADTGTTEPCGGAGTAFTA